MTDLLPPPLIRCSWCGNLEPGELHREPFRFEALCSCGRLILDPEPEPADLDLEPPAWLEPAGDVVAFPGVTVADALAGADDLGRAIREVAEVFAVDPDEVERWSRELRRSLDTGVRILPLDEDLGLRATANLLDYLATVEGHARRLDVPVVEATLADDALTRAFGEEATTAMGPRIEQVRRRTIPS